MGKKIKVRVKILNMTYDKDNNLFKLSLRDLDKVKHTNIAVKGTDWGITPDVPVEIINQFCEEMKGKEKNLFIEIDKSSIRDLKRDEDGKISQEQINKINSSVDNYPINEIMNNIQSKEQKDES